MTSSNASIANIPVITIDGPSGVGKGTLSGLVASHFNWNYLDSGALYRITAYAALNNHIDLTDAENSEAQITKLALSLNIHFKNNGDVMLNNNNISQQIRTQQCGNNASIIAALPKVREALLQKQKDFCMLPGLVADGRDMGTVVFPQASYKIFLTASAEERGKRRYKQLQNYNENAIFTGSPEIITSVEEIIDEIEQRDERDMNRSVSPLIPAKDAIVIDTSNMSIDEVFNKILTLCQPQ
jgi:CMP/dCMP kinase